MNSVIRFAAALAGALLAASAVAAEPVRTGPGGVAVEGHDVVAYFDQGRPTEGSKAFTTTWNGAEWRFASEEHLQAFEEHPEKYAPQYGGYCAWAVAHGYTARGDPGQWTVHDGRLYLNYNAAIKRKWLPQRAALIERGDRNWPGLRDG